MPIGAAIAGGAVIGGVAGAIKDKVSQSNTSGISLDPASALENQANSTLMNAFNDYTGMVNAGAGQSDVTAGYNAQKDFASLLDQYSKGAYNPTVSDIAQSNDLFAKLFNPQRVGIQQAFDDQTTAATRQAALMGRDINDPVLRAKLGQEQTRQMNMLNAQQGAASMQYALQQPMQRLDFAAQKTNVLSGLATQAMQNRQALASMGSGIMNDERTFRLNTGTKWGNQATESGGGLGGALKGALAGAGAGMSFASGMNGMFQTSQPLSYSSPMMGQVPQSYDGNRSFGLMGRTPTASPSLFSSPSFLFGGR